MQDINFRHIATQIGNSLKYSTSVNEIDRIGQSILRVNKENFPNTAITSVRAQSLYNWVLSLAKTPLDSTERVKRLINFCLELTPEEHKKTTIEFLEKNHIEALESDLGEYIVQLLGQKPYHIVTPAMHLSKEEIAALFHEKFGTAPDATPEALTAFVRKLLREKFESADIGITGANFLIAQTGSVALTENEGNARLVTSVFWAPNTSA